MGENKVAKKENKGDDIWMDEKLDLCGWRSKLKVEP
jgi:hypothetical protein